MIQQNQTNVKAQITQTTETLQTE